MLEKSYLVKILKHSSQASISISDLSGNASSFSLFNAMVAYWFLIPLFLEISSSYPFFYRNFIMKRFWILLENAFDKFQQTLKTYL